MDIVCNMVSAWVGMLQTFVDVMYWPMNMMGIISPPVATWFAPVFPTCNLGG